jgi:uncharacterized protein YlxW (UPF0749 family)
MTGSGMHRRRHQVTVTAVAFLLGILVVVQLRSQQATPGLAGLSSQELTVLIANLSTRNDQLRAEVRSLEGEVATLATNLSRGATSVDQLQGDLSRLRAWGGMEAVHGPGVTITVAGPIPGFAVEDVINELRNAGAEAIAVGDTRSVPGAIVWGAPGELVIDGMSLPPTFEIRAIGNSQILTASLVRVGGVITQLAATQPEVQLLVTPLERMELPATRRSLVPEHGRPRL